MKYLKRKQFVSGCCFAFMCRICETYLPRFPENMFHVKFSLCCACDLRDGHVSNALVTNNRIG